MQDIEVLKSNYRIAIKLIHLYALDKAASYNFFLFYVKFFSIFPGS